MAKRPRDSGDSDGPVLLRTVRPMVRVPRAGARSFAAVFTLGGGALFLFFGICVMSPTPEQHLLLAAAVLCIPLVVLALWHHTPRFQGWWRRARPGATGHLTIWQRRRRFWPRRKRPRPDPATPPPSRAEPEPEPGSLFVPSPARDE